MTKCKKKIILISLLILIIGLFSGYGIFSYYYKLSQNSITNSHSDIPYEEFEQYSGNVSDLIEIETEEDILEKRNKLIQYIWKKEKLPITKYPVIIKDISYERYLEMENLQSIDKLIINMDYNFSSIIYHFHSSKPNNKLIIYHQGHDGDFILGYNIINELLNNGYDVIAISMPLLGMNNQPEIKMPRFGNLKFTNHNQFIFLDNNNFSSIKLFVEPVIVSVNYAENLNYEEINMIGISGGGWTTVLSSAIDSRISKSYSVAGSYPIYIKFIDKRDYGDYEQIEPNLYRIANYLELYIMGSYGDNRKQIQILNIYDSCCFAGRKYLSYNSTIYQKMQTLGKGNFSIFTDDTHHEHKISKSVLKFIIDDLK